MTLISWHHSLRRYSLISVSCQCYWVYDYNLIMHFFTLKSSSRLFTALPSATLVFQAAAQNYCSPLGPILPAARLTSSNDVVTKIIQGILSELHEQTQSLNASALSINIKSTYETTPLLNFHHTLPFFNSKGTHKVDINTVYRVASISKVYTVLAILQLEDKINLSDPVTKYVPELNELAKEKSAQNAITVVEWHSVTIGALCNQLGGISAVRE